MSAEREVQRLRAINDALRHDVDHLAGVVRGLRCELLRYRPDPTVTLHPAPLPPGAFFVTVAARTQACIALGQVIPHPYGSAIPPVHVPVQRTLCGRPWSSYGTLRSGYGWPEEGHVCGECRALVVVEAVGAQEVLFS